MGTEANENENYQKNLLSKFTGWGGKRRIGAPPERSVYLRHLEAECRALFEESKEENHRALIARLDEMKRKGSADPSFPAWHDIHRFEIEFVGQLLPEPHRLRRKVWSLRERYKTVVGQHDYELYLASKPPDPTSSQEKELIADAEFLLKEILQRYSFTPIFESARQSKLWKVAIPTLIGGLLAAAIVWSHNPEQSKPENSLTPLTMLTVVFVGAMGGLASMLQRYQNLPRDGDQVNNLNELNQAGTYLPALTGAVFAMVFYVMVASGLLQGDLFPELLVHKSSNIKATATLFDLVEKARAVSASDYAKLVVWSFISGFAERFVPDRLAGFIARK